MTRVDARLHRRIEPNSHNLLPDLTELWRFRDLGRMFALRDLRLRYRQTAIGVAWVFIQPLLAAGAFTIVFGVVAGLPSNGVPYFVFSLCGMTGWIAFSSALTRSGQSLIANTQLVTKSYFPRLWLPLSTLGAVIVDFAVSFVLLIALMIVYGVAPPAQLLTMPLWVVAIVALALGPGLVSAAVSARYRDVQYVTPLIVQLLLYLSPVAYAATAVPRSVQWFYAINPLAAMLDGFRWSVLGSTPPSMSRVAVAAATAVVSLVIGLSVFAATERKLADVI